MQPQIQPQIQPQNTATQHEMMIIGVYSPTQPTMGAGAPGFLVTTVAITQQATNAFLNNMRNCTKNLF